MARIRCPECGRDHAVGRDGMGGYYCHDCSITFLREEAYEPDSRSKYKRFSNEED